ncbi:GATA transcription factor 5-like [Cornus florida]|uniref:GATA transcription factor 5-like n=1 Tax=Cornus florida TaxID=4283 RepID=UPI0028970F15|nr:GATA transcription factor 5-like [Cornus florida]
MECNFERALKSSFSRELATQQVLLDDLFCLNKINGVSCDDFSVDVFLDLSGEDFKDGSVEELELELEEEEEKDSVFLSSQDRVGDDNSVFSGTSDSGSLATDELAVPVDDMEDLEWLSQFVDDSVSDSSLLCPAGSFQEKTGNFAGTRSEPEAEPAVSGVPSPCFPAPFPAKPRSKRPRTNGRVWSYGSTSLTESSSSLSSSSSTGSSMPCLIFANPVHDIDALYRVGRPAAKKHKKNPAADSSCGSLTQRRCSHCLVQKTPQWRTGPLGPKTLCNACGVRYKSGRLFPEYRPACSPTFSGDVHSNSHRKVLEMRRKKEVPVMESGLTSMVPTF